jgi:hypothetical protein
MSGIGTSFTKTTSGVATAGAGDAATAGAGDAATRAACKGSDSEFVDSPTGCWWSREFVNEDTNGNRGAKKDDLRTYLSFSICRRSVRELCANKMKKFE